jgi:hypothetical protein
LRFDNDIWWLSLPSTEAVNHSSPHLPSNHTKVARPFKAVGVYQVKPVTSDTRPTLAAAVILLVGAGLVVYGWWGYNHLIGYCAGPNGPCSIFHFTLWPYAPLMAVGFILVLIGAISLFGALSTRWVQQLGI